MTEIEPTLKMVAFYECRTQQHIDRVRRCFNLSAISSETEIAIAIDALEELRFNGVPNDGSNS